MNILTDGGVDVTEAVKAVFDIAYNSMDHGSGFLDTEEIAELLVLARLILPAEDSAILDLQAEEKRMKVSSPKPHEFVPDRPSSYRNLVYCNECGRHKEAQTWHYGAGGERSVNIIHP